MDKPTIHYTIITTRNSRPHHVNTECHQICNTSAARATSHNIDNLYNLTTSLTTSINFHQLILYIRSVFANLCDSLNYIQTVSAHTMDYINAATSGILSPYILPVIDLQTMLSHIADALPPMLHLPVSPDDTLHF